MRLFPEITLEDAERVVKAHHAAEMAKKAQELQRYIGRYFRRQGDMDFIIGDTDSLVYAMPVSVANPDYPRLVGLDFRRYRSGVTVNTASTIDISRGGWIEIEASEFWGAAKLTLSEMTVALTESLA